VTSRILYVLRKKALVKDDLTVVFFTVTMPVSITIADWFNVPDQVMIDILPDNVLLEIFFFL
jgi:hypothetical protein